MTDSREPADPPDADAPGDDAPNVDALNVDAHDPRGFHDARTVSPPSDVAPELHDDTDA